MTKNNSASRLALEPRYVFDAALAAEFIHHIAAIEMTLDSIDTSSWSGVSLTEAFESLKQSQQAIVDVLTAMPAVEKNSANAAADDQLVDSVEFEQIHDFARPIDLNDVYLVDDTGMYLYPTDEVVDYFDPMLIGDAKPVDETGMFLDNGWEVLPLETVGVVTDHPVEIVDLTVEQGPILIDDTGMVPKDLPEPILIIDPVEHELPPMESGEALLEVVDPILIIDPIEIPPPMTFVDTNILPEDLVDPILIVDPVEYPLPDQGVDLTGSAPVDPILTIDPVVVPPPLTFVDTNILPEDLIDPILIVDPIEYPLPDQGVDLTAQPTVDLVDPILIIDPVEHVLPPEVVDPVLIIDPVEILLPEVTDVIEVDEPLLHPYDPLGPNDPVEVPNEPEASVALTPHISHINPLFRGLDMKQDHAATSFDFLANLVSNADKQNTSFHTVLDLLAHKFNAEQSTPVESMAHRVTILDLLRKSA